MNVDEIEAPDEAASRRIALNIYREIREEHDWGRRFPAAPGAELLGCVASFSPREMRRLINKAFGNASLAGRDELAASDIDEQRPHKKARIGF